MTSLSLSIFPHLVLSATLSIGLAAFSPVYAQSSKSVASAVSAAPPPSKEAIALNNERKIETEDANDKMHGSMSIRYSLDADYDFMRAMLAHHEGAVDMAKIELKYGKDEKAQKLAKNIIRAQIREIKMMKFWIAEYEKANPEVTKSVASPSRPALPAAALTPAVKPSPPHKH